jgi:hypothetical protein
MVGGAIIIRRSVAGKIGTGLARERTTGPSFGASSASGWGTQSIGEGAEPAGELVVQVPKLAASFERKGSEAKPGQNGHEDEAVPELQTPADGVEKH